MKNGLLVPIAAAIVVTSAAAAADEPKETTTTTTTTSAATTPAPITTAPVSTAPSPMADPSLSTSTSSSSRDTVTLYQYYRPNKPWLYTGGLLFLGSYVPTAVLTATNDLDRSLYIPVVGPWLHLADQPQDATTTDTVLIAGSGVLQGAGVLMMAASLFIPERVPAATIQAGNVKINVSPTTMGRGSGGIGAAGTF
jgi:hypothetical protein